MIGQVERYLATKPASTASTCRLPAGVGEPGQPAPGHDAKRGWAVANPDLLVEIDAIAVVPE